MIRRNIDVIAILMLLAGFSALSQVKHTVENMPALVRASLSTHGSSCPTAARILSRLCVFQAAQ